MASIESNKPVNTVSFPPTNWDSVMTDGYPSRQQKYININTQYGWACPRCGKIDAPWANQCTCHRETTTIWGSTTTNNPNLNVKSNSVTLNKDSISTYTIHNGETKA